MSSYTAVFYLADTRHTPTETLAKIQETYDFTHQRLYLFFGNWDEDPRELWQIPEVRSWCQAFIRLGGLHYLMPYTNELETSSPGMVPCQLLLIAIAGFPGVTIQGFDLQVNPAEVQKLLNEYTN